VQLRQPAFLEGRTTGVLTGEYNVYPLLYQLPKQVAPESERIIGYQELRGQAGLERSFWGFHFTVAPSYAVRANFPFTYQGDMPEGLDTVRVMYPELVVALDFRDDALQPHQGILLRNALQTAGFPPLGDVRDIRLQPEAYVFLPMSKTVTLALRGTVGLLFPFDYGESLSATGEQSATSPSTIRDQQRLLFRVFYSGGSASNRGYPYRGVGPHGPLGFLVRSSERCSLDPSDPNPPSCLRPLGGLSMWEGSIEVRFPIVGPLRGATFVDASNVTRQEASLGFDVPHVSPGFGIRYLTPVGPLRIDLGWHVQVNETAQYQTGEPKLNPIFGVPWLPRALHFAIGEAF
jgi:outer membrane protein insertion porin family/translocation and assembly module TamA